MHYDFEKNDSKYNELKHALTELVQMRRSSCLHIIDPHWRTCGIG